MKRSTSLIIIAIITLLVVVANIARLNTKVTGVSVQIDYGTSDTLISANKVERYILNKVPQLTTLDIKDVDEEYVSRVVSELPYLLDNNVTVSLGCKVMVKATQRKPIVRLFYRGKEFYLDETGHCVPLSSEGEGNVMVANGTFHQQLGANYQQMDLTTFRSDSVKRNFDIMKVWETALFLCQHPEYDKHFDQLYLQSNGDIILVPAIGDFTVNIGTSDDLEKKFENLDKFYKKVLPKTGWDYYQSISLKYDKQVVCTKRKKQ